MFVWLRYRRKIEMAECETCAYIVKKKKRRCRLQPVKGSIFCAEHLDIDESIPTGDLLSQKRRIPCPLDPNHTVFEHLIHKHLKKCNVAKRPQQFCSTPNINSGTVGYEALPEEKLSLSEFPEDRIEELIARVEKAYTENIGEVEMSVLEHPAMARELEDAKNGHSALKHLKQQASMLGHLEKLNLLSPNTCFIEFGAGRGKLSHWVQKAVGDGGAHYVLVDRANCRRKMDGVNKTANTGAIFQRLLMDIEHLDLGKLESLHSPHVRQTVGISKHLCGAATDLTLRCLMETLPSLSLPVPVDDLWSSEHCQKTSTEPAESPGHSPHAARLQDHLREKSRSGEKGKEDSGLSTAEECVELKQNLLPLQKHCPKLAGVLVALCCHHRCSWPHLVGKEFFTSLGFSPTDFHIISLMSSWAVCGMRPQKTASTDSTDVAGGEGSHTDTSHKDCCCTPTSFDHSPGAKAVSSSPIMEDKYKLKGRQTPLCYVPHPKEPIGLKCKRLIDAARVWYLQQHGLDARLVYFVKQSTSLENVLLIAVPPMC